MSRAVLWITLTAAVAAPLCAEPDGKPTVVPAVLSAVAPTGAQRGRTVTMTLTGARLAGATGVFFDDPAITGRVLPAADSAETDKVSVEAVVGAEASIGVHKLFLQTPRGTTGSVAFAVGDWTEVAEVEPNDTAAAAQNVEPPVTLMGRLERVGDVDRFRFEARAGQEVVFQVVASSIGSRLNPVLTLSDAEGRVVATANTAGSRRDPLLGHRVAAAGGYQLELRDFENASGADVFYRLNIGEFPVVTAVYPLGLRQGTSASVRLSGFNLGADPVVEVSASADGAKRAHALPLPGTGAQRRQGLVSPTLAVGEDPEVEEVEATSELVQRVETPVMINGRIHAPSQSADVDQFRFRAQKGQPLVLEVTARRLGSPLDSLIEVLDARGRSIERATIRPVAETSLVLNGRDSDSSGFRIQSWTDLAVNDTVFIGRELLQISRLPGGPDEDASLLSFRGRRIGLLDTTPEAQSLGTRLYKVQVHPPGKSFPPNGMPLFRIYYRNDDGNALYGKDSRLTFDPPADAEYIVRITDVRGQQGPDYGYRLSIHPLRPDFRLAFSPEHPNLLRGSSVPVTASVERYDGFAGPVAVELEGLPAGVTATRGVIAAGSERLTLTLTASADVAAEEAASASPIRLIGRATMADGEVVRTVEPASGRRLLTVLPAPDIRVTTDLRQVTLRPGGEVELIARVDRQNGFKGRVPIDVKNLPFGVQVRDVGLNGVLVTEQESSRRFVIVAEPWVKPQTASFIAVGRVESDPATEVASEPITLTIVAGEKQASR
jgi:hypothetical protein